jgi:hypothetical protein
VDALLTLLRSNSENIRSALVRLPLKKGVCYGI